MLSCFVAKIEWKNIFYGYILTRDIIASFNFYIVIIGFITIDQNNIDIHLELTMRYIRTFFNLSYLETLPCSLYALSIRKINEQTY